MSEQTSKLKIQAQAEIADLLRYTGAIKAAREELDKYTASAQRANQVSNPIQPATAATPGDGDAPPPPEGAAPATGAAQGPPGATPPAEGGAPPAAPAGAAPQPPGATSGAGTTPPPGPRGAQPGFRAPPRATDRQRAAARERIVQAPQSFVKQTAATAIGMGLGNSIGGFVLSAPQTYLLVERIMGQLVHRFRETGESLASFGSNLGYTVSQMAGFAETLGARTDGIDRTTFQRYAGFARFTGMDPNAAMGGLGTIHRRMGRGITQGELAAMLRQADLQGMGQGRLAEFLSQFESAMSDQFAATGAARFHHGLAHAALPSFVHGEGTMAAYNDTSLSRGLDGMMQQGPMKTFLLRAMGFGTEDGPSFIEAMKRREAGVHDPRNLRDIFGAFRDMGWSRGEQFSALYDVAQGQLKTWQVEKLVDRFGGLQDHVRVKPDGTAETYDPLAEYVKAASGVDPDQQERFLERMLKTSDQRAAWDTSGFAGLGEGTVTTGEAVDVNLERMRIAIGGPLAQSILPIQRSVENIFQAIQNLIGVDWNVIPQIARNIEALTKLTELVTSGRVTPRAAIGAVGADLVHNARTNIPMNVQRGYAEGLHLGAEAFAMGPYTALGRSAGRMLDGRAGMLAALPRLDQGPAGGGR